MSQRGIRGLEFKAELAELFLRLGELSRGGPAIHARCDLSSKGEELDVPSRTKELAHTCRLAESPKCTRRVGSKFDR